MKEPILELKNIQKSFDGVKALKNVNLTIYPGEIHCLAGENGCGKSTLIKIISGAYEKTSGEIYIEGKKTERLTPMKSIEKGIQVIYQDFAVFPNLTVAENISMNKILMEKQKIINWKEAKKTAIDGIKQIGARMDPDAVVGNLPVADKQMVAICRAIINDAKILILDEPTTALTTKEITMLYKILRRLREKNMAIILVNHKLNEIYEIADRLTILRNGENVATGMIVEFTNERFIKCMTGRELKQTVWKPEPGGKEIFKVSKLASIGVFDDISFELYKGDILGITGLLGSGRSEIGEALFGLKKIDSGEIYLKGRPLQIHSVQDAVRNKIAYVPEDRLTEGLFLDSSIRDNTVVASLKKYKIKHRMDRRKMISATIEWIKKLGCVANSPNAAIRTLSGGNAQKIVIAKWLNTNPDLLILNGPTVGVDVGAKSDIHEILHNLANDGVGIIIISDDLQEILQNCNKILVIRKGHTAGVVSSSSLDEQELQKMLGGSK
ncbi:sugar ABC transporter ATP-binding protein [Faecalicatena acetigenes]|uniref:Sugar ABC transporter ATP-binding protein n=1 Tax=Faecalicatena acetigenes TaxID=2981790 RepID=A0ABT2T7H7_9FIRM|nr:MULTISPECIES: sugar ABC transporter ATP-binding protein [Lachnospiraceae]MCU6746213.1 sugar ABC transporter ATP-binding protein [Faecalicatena acetigenes]SCH01695.1 Arabinose import ATP-binding protein AraG [uncultured Clostridium sp.]